MHPGNTTDTDNTSNGLRRLPDEQPTDDNVQCSYCPKPAMRAYGARVNDENGGTIVKQRAICADCLMRVFDRVLRDPVTLDASLGVDP